MSDPVTNVEIEDVLASIRRLVSEEARPEPHVSATPGKLVLTPSLRVEIPETTAFASSGVTDEPRVEFHHERTATPLKAVAPAEATFVELPPELAMEEAEAEVEYAPEAEMEAQAEFAPEAEIAAEAEVLAAPDAVKIPRTPLENRIADLESAVADQMDQWEPDGDDEADAYSGSAVDSLAWVDHVPINDTLEDAQDDDWEEDADGDEPEAAQSVASELPAAAATAPEPTHKEAEFVDVEEQDFAEYELESDAELDDEADDTETAAQAFGLFGSEEEGFLDEEALRELITEIVRQELQGTLGERITRNVRKLVRREIQRALTVQDLQ